MRAFLSCGLLAVAACVTPPASNVARADEAAVERLDQDMAGLDVFSVAWLAAYQSGDFEAMRDLYEPDAWLMTRDQPARKGVDAILAYFASSREIGSTATMTFETESVDIDGDYAFKTALWWLNSPQAVGEPLTDSGRSLVIFKRGSDGKWRLWRDIDNNTPDVAIEDISE